MLRPQSAGANLAGITAGATVDTGVVAVQDVINNRGMRIL
jgi:hypothetical protein